MTYTIIFRPGVIKEIRKIPLLFRRKIEMALTLLKTDPVPLGCRKLDGFKNGYRLRVGDYRIIYELKAEVRIVAVSRIRHRKDVYRGL